MVGGAHPTMMEAIAPVPFFFFAIKAIFALAALVGLPVLLGLLAYGVIKNRPVIAAAAGAVLLVGILFGAGTLYFFASMPSADMMNPAPVWAGGPFNGSGNFDRASGHTIRGNVSFFGLLLLGAAVAGLVMLARRLTSDRRAEARVGWSPAWLLLVLAPFVLLWLLGTTRMQRSVEFRQEAAVELSHEHVARQQAELERRQAELARRTAELSKRLEHRIENMEIHELMDMFEAPRIMLTMPSPSPMSLLAKAVLPAEAPEASSPPKQEARTGELAMNAEARDSRSSDDDAQLKAEAEAATEAIVAENAATAAESPAAGEVKLSTPIGASAARTANDAERPDWVRRPPTRISKVQREVLATEEWATEAECERARDIGLMFKAYERIQMLVSAPYERYPSDYRFDVENAWSDHRIDQLNRAGVTVDYLRREVAKEEYLETVERNFGPMKKLYTLVEFSPAVDRELRQRWEAYQRQERMAVVGVGAGAVLSLLGLTFGLLKVDTWTKGYYTKRLFLGVPLGIIGIVTLIWFVQLLTERPLPPF